MLTNSEFKSCVILVILTVIFSAAATLPLGVFSFVFNAFLAAFIGYSITRHHFYFVATLCACALAVASLFLKSITASFSLMIPTILCGISLGIVYNLRISTSKTLGILTGIYTLDFLLSMKLITTGDKNALKNRFLVAADEYKNAFATIYKGKFDEAQLTELFNEMTETLIKFMPAFIIILCGILALFMLVVYKLTLKITKRNAAFIKPFYLWHADKSFSIVFFVILALNFFFPSSEYLRDALLNVALISEIIFYIFGLSYLDFLFNKNIKNKHVKRALLVLIVSFSFGISIIIVSFIGALDGIINFREKILTNQSANQE